MAEAESGHRRRLEAPMGELGIAIPAPGTVHISRWLRLQARFAAIDRLLAAREAAEADHPDAMLRLLRAEELGGAKAGGDPVQASLATGIFAGVGGATYAIGLAFS